MSKSILKIVGYLELIWWLFGIKDYDGGGYPQQCVLHNTRLNNPKTSTLFIDGRFYLGYIWTKGVNCQVSHVDIYSPRSLRLTVAPLITIEFSLTLREAFKFIIHFKDKQLFLTRLD